MISESWRFWVGVAGVLGIVGAGAGAYGYHWLAGDSGLREIFATAVQYHMWHTLALFGVAWLAAHRSGPSGRWAVRAGWFFVAGIVMFSGSLYAFCITGEIPVPGAAPIGGLLFISGWAMLVWSTMRRNQPKADG